MNNVKWYDLNQDGYIINNNKIIWPLLEKGGIYVYKLSVGGGEKLYVGSSINIKQRFRQHKYRSLQMSTEYNSILYKYVLKHGWQNFNYGVLEYIDLDKSDSCIASKRKVLYDIEQRYLDRINPSLNINKFAGSMKGYKHNLETKNNYSKVRTGRCYKKIKGIIVRPEVSQETILRLKLHSKSLKVKIYSKDYKEIKEFNSIKNAAEYVKLSPTSVSKYIKSGKIWNGVASLGNEVPSYYFKLESSVAENASFNLSFPLEDIVTKKTKLDNIDVSYPNYSRRAYIFEVVAENNVIYRFKSITKASEFLNISRRTLTIYSQNNKLWKDKFAFKIIKAS